MPKIRVVNADADGRVLDERLVDAVTVQSGGIRLFQTDGLRSHMLQVGHYQPGTYFLVSIVDESSTFMGAAPPA